MCVMHMPSLLFSIAIKNICVHNTVGSVSPLQAAQRGMEAALKQLTSASDEQSKAEAQVAVDFHEALLQSVKA